MTLGGIVLIIGGVLAYQNAEKTEKQKFKLITGDEMSQQLEVTLSPDADANIGAELSSILRNKQE